jgi:type IV pilus assembly protein PilO
MADISLSKLPWWGQIIAFVLLAAGAVYAVEHYYIADMAGEAKSRETRLSVLKADISRGLATARRLPEFRTQVTDLERRLDALKAVLPEQKDVADLLRRLQTLATQSDLTIRAFQPRAISQKELHAEWPIGLEIEGTYHNLGFFLDRVAKFPRIINVSELRIQAMQRPSPNATITARCTATTFVLSEKPAQAAPARRGRRAARRGA